MIRMALQSFGNQTVTVLGYELSIGAGKGVLVFHRSQRLLLRPVWPEDWQGIKAGIADLLVLRNLASAPHPYSEEDARAFVSRPIPKLHPRFVITLAEDATIIGTIGIDPTPDFDAEIGYWIARKYWGHGFATEAGKAVIKMARSLGFRTLGAAHFEDNPASGKVLRNLGFRPTATRRMQHSLGRGEAASAIEFSLDLEEEMGVAAADMLEPMPQFA